MAASTSDKFTETFNSTNPNVAKVASARASAATTLSCDSLTGWPTNTKVHFSTYKVGADGKVITGSQIDWTGIVSGNNIGSLERQAGASDGGNAVNDIVEMNPTAKWAQDLAVGLQVSHNLDGSLKDNIVTTSKINNSAVTTAKINNGAVTSDKIDFATLLPSLFTAFGANIQILANAGSAGGTIKYLNLGGLKILWATSAVIATSTTPAAKTFALPASFFTSAPTVVASIAPATATALQYSGIDTAAVGTIAINVWASTSASGAINVFAMGT